MPLFFTECGSSWASWIMNYCWQSKDTPSAKKQSPGRILGCILQFLMTHAVHQKLCSGFAFTYFVNSNCRVQVLKNFWYNVQVIPNPSATLSHYTAGGVTHNWTCFCRKGIMCLPLKTWICILPQNPSYATFFAWWRYLCRFLVLGVDPILIESVKCWSWYRLKLLIDALLHSCL